MSADESEFEPVFIRLRGRVQGPFTAAQLQLMHQRGQFSRAHEVSEDRLNWRSAATLTNVFVAPKARPLPQLKPVPKPEPDDALVDLDDEVEEPVRKPVVMGPAKMVKPVWHYSVGKDTYGPVTILELRALLAGGQLKGSDLVWKEGLADWAPAAEVEELSGSPGHSAPGKAGSVQIQSNYCSACGNAMDSRAEICPKCGVRQQGGGSSKNRMIAALLAIFLGQFGLHRFYLEQPIRGLAFNFVWMVFIAGAFVFALAGLRPLALLFFLGAGLPALAAFIEGVVFLCMSDESFSRRHRRR